MSFEYSSNIDQKINIQDFTRAINDGDVISAKCLYHENDHISVGFKFNNIPDHSWGDDAVMKIKNNKVYLVINAGDLKQREGLIAAIQNSLKDCGVPVELEELSVNLAA